VDISGNILLETCHQIGEHWLLPLPTPAAPLAAFLSVPELCRCNGVFLDVQPGSFLLLILISLFMDLFQVYHGL